LRELAIQKYLRKFPPLQAITEAKNELGLHVNEANGLAQFNYGIDADHNIPELNECRGLILEWGTWNVVAYPFHRFFNLGQMAAKMEYPGYSVEKLDGTLMIVYEHKNRMYVATRGRILADGSVYNFGESSNLTFRQLFWMQAEKYGLTPDPITWYADSCGNVPAKGWFEGSVFMFELVTKYNRVVVPYAEDDIYLIGARDMTTGDEHDLDALEALSATLGNGKIRTAGEKSEITSAEGAYALSSLFKDVNGFEGFVIVGSSVDDNGNLPRVKIKLPKYVAAHNMLGNNFSEKRVLELMNTDSVEEFIASFPDYKTRIDMIIAKVSWLLIKVGDIYNKAITDVADITDEREHRKQFAELANQTDYAPILFQMYNGKLRGFRDAKGRLLGMSPEDLLPLINDCSG
jgi:hypothetical protein